MAEGVISDLAAKALPSLAKAASRKAVSWWGARDDLKKLENTLTFIQARVCDAERRQEEENSDTIKLWLQELKLVLYRADDLFHLVLTVDRQNLQAQRRSMMAKVGVLFSMSGPFYNDRKIALEIKSIRKELDSIKSDMKGLNLSANLIIGLPLPMQLLIDKRQVASFVKTDDVIGRENDKNIIIRMLFDPNDHDGKRITVIPIVGFGGLGKTTLAQLVFNDEGVQDHFDLTKWVCVPAVNDQDNEDIVMRSVYQALYPKWKNSEFLINHIKSGINLSIKDKKYLLVLDNIWDESWDNWLDLLVLLDCGKSGSRVILTTRSLNVVKAVGASEAYKLGLLTKEDSWNLFKILAFKSRQEENNPNLTQIGEEIVDRLGNVPLAIKVVGSLLCSKNSEEEWQLFKDDKLSKARLNEAGNIMPVLKLSYDYLPPTLKQYFAYCSLFPKGYVYNKANLVQLWMAQGYIEPSIGDQYFLELLGRNLFQDPQEDDLGNVISCKMHDLAHDLAQIVAGDESKQLIESLIEINLGVTHVSVVLPDEYGTWEAPPMLTSARNLRSLLLFSNMYRRCSIGASSLERVFSKCRFLCALSLEDTSIFMVPNSIGKLRHLRYLNLARTCIEYLPNDITRLINLQTLNVGGCSQLKELPNDFGKLANLCQLLILGSFVTDLPSGFGKISSLQELDIFIVGRGNGIDSLPALNLRGCLRIYFSVLRCDAVLEAQRAHLKDNQQLNSLVLTFRSLKEIIECELLDELGKSDDCFNFERTEEKFTFVRMTGEMKDIPLPLQTRKIPEPCDSGKLDTMLSSLQLPPNLKIMEFSGYQGVKMPHRWFDGLSKLVSIHIVFCTDCIVLPHLSQLPHLKYLNLEFLCSLEYIEDEDDIWVGGASGKYGSVAYNDYFPSLEVLDLKLLDNVKKWTRPSKEDDDGEPRQLVFPRLLRINVDNCPVFMSMPLAPKLESLVARGINGKLFIANLMLLHEDQEASATLITSLKQLDFWNISGVVSLSVSSRLCNLQTVKLRNCNNLKSLTFESSDSIRHLIIQDCEKLKMLSVGNLSVLEMLTIDNCKGFSQLPQSIVCLTSLQHLKIESLRLKELPEEMVNLSLLHKLEISYCLKLASLPPSLLGLASLQTLEVFNCPNLEQRLKQPNGQHCHLIRNIPHVRLFTDPRWMGGWQTEYFDFESESESQTESESE